MTIKTLESSHGNNITRRNFVKNSATAVAATLAGATIPYGIIKDPTISRTLKKQPWLDTHIHVSDIGQDGKKRESMLDDLLQVLDNSDADLKIAISPHGDYISNMVTDPSAMMVGNRMIHDLCQRAPGRLFGSCMVNPNFLDESLRVMNICFEEWGFVQLGEMLPFKHKYRINDYNSQKITQLAAKYDVPVQVHLGTYWLKGAVPFDNMDSMNQMGDLLDLADRVPQAKYILAHAIGCGPTKEYISWANMFLDTLQGVFPKFPDNFWVEIRDFQTPALTRTIHEIPVTRILSGTDWTTEIGPPFKPYGTMYELTLDKFKSMKSPFPPKVSSFVGFLHKAGANEDDIERIGYKNAVELYKLHQM
jgi:predicted TIM-barrel fold metal-dependent hydrolase